MQVTREEFLQWKDSPVTKAVMATVEYRIEEAKEILAASAGVEPDADRMCVGMIRAFREVLDISFED